MQYGCYGMLLNNALESRFVMRVYRVKLKYFVILFLSLFKFRLLILWSLWGHILWETWNRLRRLENHKYNNKLWQVLLKTFFSCTLNLLGLLGLQRRTLTPKNKSTTSLILTWQDILKTPLLRHRRRTFSVAVTLANRLLSCMAVKLGLLPGFLKWAFRFLLLLELSGGYIYFYGNVYDGSLEQRGEEAGGKLAKIVGERRRPRRMVIHMLHSWQRTF